MRLCEGCRLRKSRRFPGRFRARGRHTAVVGMGCNLGDCARRFERVVAYLQKGRRVQVKATSPLLLNPPFGYRDQPFFLNGVMVLQTALDPFALLRYLLWTEKRFGRKRLFANAPRTLDLDIIFYDQTRLRTRRLRLPHPGWQSRPSVTIPLMLLGG